jgi:16S rRNA processing protein RimM
MALVVIGRIGRAHGLHGEVTLDGCSLTPLELHAVKEFVWRGPRREERPLRIHTARPANARILVGFEGYDDRDRAATLGRGELLAEEERLPDAGPGQVYTFQLVGLEVRTEEGRLIGTVADVLATGAHPIYVVKGERELMVPAAEEVVRRVDLERRVITVSLPPGLEEL